MQGAGVPNILHFLSVLDVPLPDPDDFCFVVPVKDHAETPSVSSETPVLPGTPSEILKTPVPSETPFLQKTPCSSEMPLPPKSPPPSETPVASKTPVVPPSETLVLQKTPVLSQTPVLPKTPLPSDSPALPQTLVSTDGVHYELPLRFQTPPVSYADAGVSKDSSLSASSPLLLTCASGSDYATSSVPCSQLSELTCESDDDDVDDNDADNDNGCDDSYRGFTVSFGTNDVQNHTKSQGGEDVGLVSNVSANTLQCDKTKVEENIVNVPVDRVKGRGRKSVKISKSGAKPSRKTGSGTTESSAKEAGKKRLAPKRVRVKLERDPSLEKVVGEGRRRRSKRRKGVVNRNADFVDFSAMMDWSSTDCELEAGLPQITESDASWRKETETETSWRDDDDDGEGKQRGGWARKKCRGQERGARGENQRDGPNRKRGQEGDVGAGEETQRDGPNRKRGQEGDIGVGEENQRNGPNRKRDHEGDIGAGEENQRDGPNRKRGRGRPKGPKKKVGRKQKREFFSQNSDSGMPRCLEASEVPRCLLCDKGFKTARGYVLHMSRIHRNPERNVKELWNAQESSEQDVQSPKIQGPVTESQSLIWRVVGVKEDVAADLFLCRWCRAVFGEPRRYFAHTAKHHPILEAKEREKLYTMPMKGVVSQQRSMQNGRQRMTYRCCRCQQAFPHYISLSQHLRLSTSTTTTPDHLQHHLTCEKDCPGGARINKDEIKIALGLEKGKTILCNACGRMFADRHRLKIHMNSVHAEKTYSCATCGAKFALYACLHTHMETHNPDRPRPHACETCGKRFTQKNRLRHHEREQHWSRGSFACEVCGKVFETRVCRNKHRRTHSAERAFVCRWCCKAFSRRCHLEVHERLHSGVKPYACGVCGSSFAQKHSLDYHRKVKHGLEVLIYPKPFDADPSPLLLSAKEEDSAGKEETAERAKMAQNEGMAQNEEMAQNEGMAQNETMTRNEEIGGKEGMARIEELAKREEMAQIQIMAGKEELARSIQMAGIGEMAGVGEMVRLDKWQGLEKW